MVSPQAFDPEAVEAYSSSEESAKAIVISAEGEIISEAIHEVSA